MRRPAVAFLDCKDHEMRLAHYRKLHEAQAKQIERLQWRAFDLETEVLMLQRQLEERSRRAA